MLQVCPAMNSEECHKRASVCAANAAIAPVESIALEFLKLAAQWRAMAVRQIFLGRVGEVAVPLAAPLPLILPN
jgi:hypothetical protein